MSKVRIKSCCNRTIQPSYISNTNDLKNDPFILLQQ